MRAQYKYLGSAKNNPHVVYIPSHTDKLWIGRAIVGEHGTKATPEAVQFFVWCMLNRFLLHPGNRHWETFLYMLRRFSQPINPRWQRDGDLAKKYKNSPMCTEEKFRRRERICALEWSDIPSAVRVDLEDFMAGALPRPEMPDWADELPTRWTNFAAATASLQRRFPEGKNVGGNWYFEDSKIRQGSVVIDLWG